MAGTQCVDTAIQARGVGVALVAAFVPDNDTAGRSLETAPEPYVQSFKIGVVRARRLAPASRDHQ